MGKLLYLFYFSNLPFFSDPTAEIRQLSRQAATSNRVSIGAKKR